jgi:hypothetical protein
MKKFMVTVVCIFLIIIFLALLVRSKSVFWQDNNNSNIKLISRVDLNNFYRSINYKGFYLVSISYKDQPRFMLNNLSTSSEIVAYSKERRLLWECYWDDTFFKLLNLKIPIKKINLFFNINEIKAEYGNNLEFFVNRNFSSCLTNSIYKGYGMNDEKILELDIENYHKMEKINNGVLLSVH